MNEDHARPRKSLVSETEIRAINYEDQPERRDHFLDLTKIIKKSKRKKDLELQVEINESVKDLISSAKELPAHLDVTLIKEKQSLQETTVSLSVNEVSDLIEMINLHNANDKKNLEHYHKSRRCSVPRKHKKTIYQPIPDHDYRDTPEANYSDGKTTTEEYAPSLNPNETAVYTTTHSTFNGLKEKLACLESHTHNDKPGTPCLCQHCGMVGVLVESQKRPAIPHMPNPKFTPASNQKSSQKRRVIDLRSKSKSETNLILLRELSHKITDLEDRINEQEEKSVRKDYFKFVIHKLLTQYSSKLNELKHIGGRTGVNISTQCSKTHGRRHSLEKDENRERIKSYYTQAVRIENSDDTDSTFASKRNHRSHSRNGQIKPREEKYDIRTKIANLIEDKLRNPIRSRRDPRTEKHNNDILKLPANMDEVKFDTNKTIFTANEKTGSPFRTRSPSPFGEQLIHAIEKEVDENMSSQTIKQLCDLVYNKYYERSKDKNRATKSATDDTNFRKTILDQKKNLVTSLLKELGEGSEKGTVNVKNQASPDIPESLLKSKRAPSSVNFRRSRSKARERNVRTFKDKVDVAYVNPAVRGWQEEQSDPEGSAYKKQNVKKANRHTIEEKIRYLKQLAKRKNVDEGELWNNILTQAKKHIKSNEDTVSIQLPGGLKSRDMSELELTLSNLKEIVKKSRAGRKSSGLSIELNYRTSSDNYIKKRDHKAQKVK